MLSVAPQPSKVLKLSMHHFMMVIEHVLPMSARVAGNLDFVSASIRRRTRTLSIVGHSGIKTLRKERSYLGLPRTKLFLGLLSNKFKATARKERSYLKYLAAQSGRQ
jgi:hypothetical protein